MNDLARQQTIRELVEVYHVQVARVRRAYAELESVQQTLTDQFAGQQQGHRSVLYIGSGYQYRHWDDPDRDLKHLESQIWRRLVDKLEVRRFISVKKSKELDRQIDRDEMPPITYENVMGLLLTLEQNAPDFAREAVVEVFEFLRVRGSDLKTNTEFELKSRVVLPFMVDFWKHCDSYRVEYEAQQKLTALENVFNLLDGKSPRLRTHHSALQESIQRPGTRGCGRTDLFEHKCFANKNLHIKFLRPDLVKRLNQVAGGMRLKPEN